MNAIPQPQQQAPSIEAERHMLTTIDLSPQAMVDLKSVAESIAQGGIVIPEHFRNKPGAVLAVMIQAIQWRINPIGVLQKTHITQGGLLGYEAQLINAIIIKNAPIVSRPEYKYFGDWSKVNGKCEERKSDKGGKYYVATYTKDDEKGLGVIVRATFIGEDEPREIVVTMQQAYPRFSTQWATDPAQQLGYLAVRKWSRRYAPDVILGAYTPEELAAREHERDMGAVDEVRADDERDAIAKTGNAALKQRMQRRPAAAREPVPTLDEVLTAIREAKNKVDMAAAAALAERLRNDEEKAIARTAYDDRREEGRRAATQQREQPEPDDQKRAQDAPTSDQSAPSDNGFTVTFAEVASSLDAAERRGDTDALAAAADLIVQVDSKDQQAELRTMFEAAMNRLEGDETGDAS
ncbi:RecT family recombinase [Caballeronia cordobensis]|uniref:RecT family recombinase n=1 Tax=Caballeronia cordobensis TaxID=1353886 RepID=UPI00045F0004|nr:DNA single-strand annealing protein RecT-like protein [Burkholderia sp. RPE67]